MRKSKRTAPTEENQTENSNKLQILQRIQYKESNITKLHPETSDCSIISNIPQPVTVMRLRNEFFSSIDCTNLGKRLLGQILCRKLPSEEFLKCRIVETESYLGAEDTASLTYGGRRTEKCEPLYMKPGTAYVYLTFGMYHCINISSKGDGCACLLRAAEPIAGIDSMKMLRKVKLKTEKELKLKDYCNGPGKLCLAMNITKEHINKEDLTESDRIWLEPGEIISEEEIVSCKRIGINTEPQWRNAPLRFYIKNSQFISVRDKIAEQ